MYQEYNSQYYSDEPLNGGEWIGSGIDFFSNLIGGKQAKKQSERELEALRLQQEITQQNNAAVLEAERLRIQRAQVEAGGSAGQQGGMNNGLKATLVISAVALAALGTVLVVKAKRAGEKSLNGLVYSLE
ncbi:hypothetical protein [uncultured Roseivirga sp.]|uniref:hypothetical protein n=1 Tax=uncultured Roseivirga sp. TaxID=543088 RepID=UPI0030D925B8|tara:strand:+ start:8471 stop:8860 length:390 start_codon:yes stop_codon:yes gene_type:complete